MSTDDPGAVGRRRARAGLRYRRSVVATIGVLAIATTGLGVAGLFRGPHLDDAAVADATALERTGQRLVLRADQAIDPVDAADVTITPDVPIEVTSDARTITVRFTGMLRALTDYDISAAVTGSATGVSGTLDFAFTTPDLEVAVLVRDPDGRDQVRRRAVSGADGVTLFTADRIQEFAVARDGIAAVLLDESGADGRLVLAPTGEGVELDIPLPGTGRLQKLRASPTTGLIGVLFSPNDPDEVMSQLLVFDPRDPSALVRPVTGLDGDVASVLDWRIVPGTGYLVVQTFDEALLLVDTADLSAPPLPLGEHAELRGFLPGTLELVVADPLSGSTIDLETGETTTLVLPDDGLDPSAYPGKVVALGGDRYVEIVSSPGPDFVLDYEILLVGPDGVDVVYDPDPGVPVRDVCLSTNAQYLAVEVQDPEGELDGYPNVSGRSGSTTYFVDLETGSANRGIAGFAASWCD
ncbi:hypothetical protein [Pseudolysinimonas sp.]|jgi:hypothetical protein|uniref:hypothetical protein n=1 Tax=Pseudolysinimonas sp. TaxID=2680009 RepID=UPI0037850F76